MTELTWRERWLRAIPSEALWYFPALDAYCTEMHFRPTWLEVLDERKRRNAGRRSRTR